MDYVGKKLLVIGGAGPHVATVEAAKEMGVYTIVVDYLPREQSPAKLISDESYQIDIFDVEKLVELGKEKKVDGVLCLGLDPAQRPANRVATQLGLPTFGTWEQTFALTDKTAFHKACVAAGVDVVPTYTEDELDSIKYPVVVKPVDSRGSRGVTICWDRESVVNALPIAKKESSNGKALIERYMQDEQEVTCAYVVKDGRSYLVSLGDRFPGRKEDNLDRQNILVVQPSRFTDMYMKDVNERVAHMISMMGIKNGAVFMQGFVDGERMYMFDPGIRFPGNEYDRIYKAANGFDVNKSIISYVVGGEILDFDGKLEGSYDLDGKVAIQYMINVGPGKIAVFDGLDEIAKHPDVVHVQQFRFAGEVIENTGDIKHRAVEVSVLCERDSKKMADIIRFVQDKVVVTDEDGKNMLISPPDPELIEKLYW